MRWTAIAVVLFAYPLCGALPAAAGCTQTVVPSPNRDPHGQNALWSISERAPDDIWAAGYSEGRPGYLSTLAMHWNGRSWRIVPTPNLQFTGNMFVSIDALRSPVAWAVGWSYGANRAISTLTEFFDGQHWRIVPSPNGSGAQNYLFGVAALYGDDAWAVGSSTATGSGQTLAEHWNGAAWTIVSSPSPGTYASLSDVAVVTAKDAWAVGATVVGGNPQTLVEHWNGSSWSIVASPNPSGYSQLTGLTAISSDDIWAVGSWNPPAGPQQTLVEHWDGSTWSVVPSPERDVASVLSNLTAHGPNSIWAVGYWVNYANQQFTLMEHWDGSAWSIIDTPRVSKGELFTSAATLDGRDIWAVGNSGGLVLTEDRHC